MQINREELAWAAGFFDGEGCISSSVFEHKRTRSIQIAIGQTDLRPLERFNRAIGGFGTIYVINRPIPLLATHKPQWSLKIGRFEHVQSTMALLWLFISEPKREQCVVAVTRYFSFERHNAYVKVGR